MLVIVVSRPDTMEVVMPCNLKKISMKTWETNDGLKGCDKAQKRGYLERISTATMMNNLLPTQGSSTIKSIEISIHIYIGTRSGCSAPCDFTISPSCPCKVLHATKKN